MSMSIKNILIVDKTKIRILQQSIFLNQYQILISLKTS